LIQLNGDHSSLLKKYLVFF